MRLVIISHTEHYKNSAGEICGWGPTIRELNHLTEICDELIHLAPLHNTKAPQSSLTYNSPKIKFVPLIASGGKGLQKLSILSSAFVNLKRIHHYTKSADYIQFRAPTGIGVYVLPYLKIIRPKRYWVKYAGNWVDSNMPLGNKFQKFWLKCVDKTVKVTLNGKWEADQRFLAFENPCLTNEEYQQAKIVVKEHKSNTLKGWQLCFVGALNRHKGVDLLLQALADLDNTYKSKITKVVFIGDGQERTEFEKIAKQTNVECEFLGFQSKRKVFEIMIQSQALILASKSEGFPKAVGEAMAYGCVPVVTDVSCLSDYIDSGVNGYLLKDRSSLALIAALKRLLDLSNQEYKAMAIKNHIFAYRFTYAFYNKSLSQLIFK